MKLTRQLRVSAESLARHKLRSSLSALGIVFGVGALVAMLSVAEGAKREVLDQIAELGTDRLVVRQAELEDAQRAAARQRLSKGLTRADAELIRATLSGLREIAPLVEVPVQLADVRSERPAQVVATSAGYFAAKGLELAAGRPLCDADVERRSLVCVLGAGVATELGGRGRTGAYIAIGKHLFEVVGVLRERGKVERRTPIVSTRDIDQTVFLPLGAQAALDARFGSDAIHELTVRVADAALLPHAAALVRRTLEIAHAGFKDYAVIVPSELIAQAFRTQRVFNLVLGAVAAISLLVGAVGILNILLASVSERTREIGIRRAVGADRVHILMHFLVEALVLTLAGAAAGIAAGSIGAWAIATFAGWTTVVTPWGVLLSLAMALVVGVAAGLYPALRAARLDPIVALRHL